MVVRIIADDLTGALDSAAPFAATRGPLPVFWDQAMIAGRGDGYALDTESREQSSAEHTWLHHLHGAELAFKKIDSLLRGNAAGEIAACLASGHFRSAIIAPAFPARDRITRLGRQHWRAAGEVAWQPVEQDLLLVLRSSLPIVHAKSAKALAGSGFFLCDAETEEHLRAIVTAGRRMAGPMLWCGSAGLARALAGPARDDACFHARAPLLMLIGSNHAVSRAQIAALETRHPDLVMPLGSTEPAAIAAAVARVADGIGRGSSSVLALALPATSAAAARPVLARAFELVAGQVQRPGTLFVTGGETLHGLLRALDARSLLATGELLPGVPCSRIAGGRWHDLAAISKSGAFGEQDLLIRLAESVMP